MITLQQIGATLGWTIFSVFLLYGALRLFDWLDPIDYREEIRKGNLAAGMLLAAKVLALGGIIITVIIVP